MLLNVILLPAAPDHLIQRRSGREPVAWGVAANDIPALSKYNIVVVILIRRLMIHNGMMVETPSKPNFDPRQFFFVICCCSCCCCCAETLVVVGRFGEGIEIVPDV